MNTSIPLSVLAIVGISAACAYFLVRAIREITAASRRVVEGLAKLTVEVAGAREEVKDLRSLMVQATSGWDKLNGSMVLIGNELQTSLAALPKIMEAMIKLGEMQYEAYKRLNRMADQKRPGSPMPLPDPDAADREYRIQTEMRERGISRSQAEIEMNPANEVSVWDTFNLGGLR